MLEPSSSPARGGGARRAEGARRITHRISNITQTPWTIRRIHTPDAAADVTVVQRGPLLIFLLLIALQLVWPAPVWIIALAGLGVILFISLLWVLWQAQEVTFTRRLMHTWVQVGDRMQEHFTLQNRSGLPVLAFEIIDHSDLPGYTVSTVRAVGANNVYRWHMYGTSQQRGLFQLGPADVRFADPLGIFSVTKHFPYTREILVYPPVLHDLTMPALSGGGQGLATARQRSLVETAAIGGVRDYRPGDSPRRIHWPLSMRHQEFLVKEFDREMGGSIWLALDLHRSVHSGEGLASTLEYAIVYVASYAWHLLHQGSSVGLFTSAPQRIIVPPVQGAENVWSILRALAPLTAGSALPFTLLLQELRSFMARGDALICFTPDAAPDWPIELARPGMQARAKSAVLFDPASFAGTAAGEQNTLAAVRTLLTGLNVPAHTIRLHDPLTAQPALQGSGNWDFITTGTGKVVPRSRPEATPL